MNSLEPRTPRALLLTTLAVALAVGGCGGGGGGGGESGPVSLDDPNNVMAALENKIVSSGGELALVQNALPPASNSVNPKANEVPEISATPGSVVTVPVQFSGKPDLEALFAKVPEASSYITGDIENDGSGTRKAAIRAVRKFETVAAPPQSVIDLQIDLSGFERGVQDKLCLDIKFSGGQLENGSDRVGDPVRICIKLVDQQPADDQPDAETLKTTLIGSWASQCIVSDDGSSAKIVFGFGQGVTYSDTIELYSTTDCSGTPEVASGLGGTYEVGASNFSETAGAWQYAFTFVPNNIEGTDLRRCYNRLRVSGTSLYLGFPATFTVDNGQAPVAGDCRSEATRPEAVNLGFPFSKR